MRYFKPINYGEENFLSYKFKDSTAITEGYWVSLATAGEFFQGQQLVEKFSTTAAYTYTGTNVGAGSIMEYTKSIGKYFPIYKEDPDPENAGATISQNDHVIGFFGKECEIHSNVSQCAVGSYSIGALVAIASTGKWTESTTTTASDLIVAQCVGTKGNWIHMRML